VSLDRQESHHIARVLRMRAGDQLELIDGEGSHCRGIIESLGRSVVVRLLEKWTDSIEPRRELWVCQGDLKGKKMEFLVQKCTELGVAYFFSFHSSRSQGRLDDQRQDRKLARWQDLVKAACKQSGRLRSMRLAEESFFGDLIKTEQFAGASTKLLLWEEEKNCRLADFDLSGADGPDGPVCLMLGPEGGFSADEAVLARQHGWTTVSLGRHILRAETATLAAVSIVQHMLGEL